MKTSSVDKVKEETAKKIETRDLRGNPNGFLVELFKDGEKTLAYLTAAAPGAFKGYHLHKVRGARYICLKGIMKIIIYVKGKREEHILTSDPPKRLYIPPHIPTGLQNIGQEEAWLINYPDPPYNPGLIGEQVDYTKEELETNNGN